MAEAKTTTEKPAEPKPASVGGKLAPAAGSSDPAVHQLMAEIYTAQQNNDKDAEKAASDALRQLGYE